MTKPTPDRKLNEIETIWVLFGVSHGENSEQIPVAQEAILEQYRAAALRYLTTCLGNSYDAEEIWQDFSVRLVRGDFRNANPEKGRFRDFLKTVLYHLIIDHHKKKRKQPAQMGVGTPEPVADPGSVCESDRDFLSTWRSSLLNQAWAALAQAEQTSNQPLHTVFHFRANNQGMQSAEMAEKLTAALGKAVSAVWVRKWVHLAKLKFAELLVREVANSLRQPTPDSVEEELIDLEIYQYCKTAVDEWRQRLKPNSP